MFELVRYLTVSASLAHSAKLQSGTEAARALFSDVGPNKHGILPNAMREYYMLGFYP